MGYSPQGCKESGITEVTEVTEHVCTYMSLLKSFDTFGQILARFLLFSTIMPLPRRLLCCRVVMFALVKSDIHCFEFSLQDKTIATLTWKEL